MKFYLVLLSLFVLFSCTPFSRFNRTGGGATYSKGKKGKGRRQYVAPGQHKMMNSINKYIGIPYKWGGMSYKGMDCSGFVKKVFWDAERIELPHNSREQSKYGHKISKSKLKFGDLVFFKIRSFRINHVGIYIGSGRFAHASRTVGVTITDLEDDYYRKKYAIAKRLYFE